MIQQARRERERSNNGMAWSALHHTVINNLAPLSLKELLSGEEGEAVEVVLR